MDGIALGMALNCFVVYLGLIMFQQLENILSAFNYDAEVALTQYLIACEIDGVEPDLSLCFQLELLIV